METQNTILIVDDESGPRESLKLILKPFYNIEIAEDGPQALEIIQKKKIDLVTLDLKMPGMQGEEVLSRIKEAHPEVEVLIITGHGTLKNAIELIRKGASGYELKPFTITEVVMNISKTLDRKNKMQKLKQIFNPG
ncbi:MAG: response regulator [Candidatus Manganitrophus sp.]|nr:response regulator [Candidatus Manganitrophus morganii]MDC4204274.1 response regulator [Candidatus Manganitrophus sp.]MDC4227164.1 response regulator [Candidatus Manganitrophus sp.]WDT71439.1 MAG: response regulator [Candidatus Manganitrophus sp.]WDT76308.1 MAG: response regulator [Candidatus Manganitrophus sp.]